MQYCVLVKEDVLVFEAVNSDESFSVIFGLFKQGFVLAPVLVEANNAENARVCFHHRFQWEDLKNAFDTKKVLLC
ncbi:hypothetical protein L4174_004925 [Photobacterium sp. CCB-ST2H9]|uniref:hypothetical protein n=1 Tax=Photobacterium sp. CCB-ST2H9 TaxID=2912855 RepID=UPI00200697DF|nr:hypothetical protein [Photobacterium sp. CCB-ST2H9]UTM58189.1 hypothetical protein L4174_004925 [Photobacterium sp. CCB-ST2H9]